MQIVTGLQASQKEYNYDKTIRDLTIRLREVIIMVSFRRQQLGHRVRSFPLFLRDSVFCLYVWWFSKFGDTRMIKQNTLKYVRI